MGALGIALDPQGNGATVNWDNPVSKSHGLVTPVGFAYPENGLICRKFSARFETTAGAEGMPGAACRDKNARVDPDRLPRASRWHVQPLAFSRVQDHIFRKDMQPGPLNGPVRDGL